MRAKTYPRHKKEVCCLSAIAWRVAGVCRLCAGVSRGERHCGGRLLRVGAGVILGGLVDFAEVGEEDDLADGVAVGEQHRQAIDTHAETAGGRHAETERLDVIDIDRVRLLVALLRPIVFVQKALQLVDGMRSVR